jgi:DNA-3-methyladenine glycosylase
MSTHKLNRKFFEQSTIDVAKGLIGKELVFGKYSGIITETEAYIGRDDPACHAAKGRTKRTEVMFGKAGFSYIYLIYGMYHCLNVVTEEEEFPAAVLIRGLWLDNMQGKHLDGPGKLCKYMEITTAHNKLDITNSDEFFIRDTDLKLNFKATSRIGISKGMDKLWRFVALL